MVDWVWMALYVGLCIFAAALQGYGVYLKLKEEKQ